MKLSMEKIVNLAKVRGFVYSGSEIYGGLANTWDYGNLGVELKNNVKKAWWKKFIQESPYNVGIDAAILMNPQTWVASGHLGNFSDPLMDCKECHERFRADKLIEDYMQEHGMEIEGSVDAWSKEEMESFINEHDVVCPTCGKKNFTEIRQFNLMFKTFQGVTEDAKNTVYRNETYPGCEGNPGDLVYSYSNTQKDPAYAEHTDEDLDGKCDICKLDFKTFEQLGLLIAKVNKNLSDGKYADVQYTTASIDNLRTALVAAETITEASSDTDVATAFDKLLAASTVGADGLIAADHNIVISFADAKRGIASGNGWYANGDTVTLKVTPSVGYIFSKWTQDKAGNTSVGKESTYTFTLGADSPDAYYAWLDEVKYTVTCESVEGGTGIASEEQYVYGQKATVTATANDNYEFVGWKDSYGTTVSTDAVYNFTVIGDATLTPEFVKVKTDEGADIAYVTVSFYHQSGKLLDSRKVVSGEGKITNTVNAPTKVGFDFLGWSAKASGATAEDVVDFKTATFSENTSLYPVFKAQDITYTLTVGSQTEQKAVTVTADPMEGKQFVGWKDANGNIVSYDSTYTFIITGDTTLTAYYEQADSEVVKEPTITIAQPTYEDITGGYKMAFYFNYTVPEDCKLVDIGIIRKKGDYKADGITLETDGISQYSVLSKLGSEGQFYYTKSNHYGTGHTVTGYMIYEKNGIRYTVYSDSIYGVKNNKYSEN